MDSCAVELRNGEMYRGRLVEAEDNMSCQLSGIVLTGKDGKVTSLEQVYEAPLGRRCRAVFILTSALPTRHLTLPRSYLRGSHVRFMILPDMLKHAPMFNRIDPKQGSHRAFVRLCCPLTVCCGASDFCGSFARFDCCLRIFRRMCSAAPCPRVSCRCSAWQGRRRGPRARR
jgi:small nuclear ribonucleoprotein (snRNP)-like protein